MRDLNGVCMAITGGCPRAAKSHGVLRITCAWSTFGSGGLSFLRSKEMMPWLVVSTVWCSAKTARGSRLGASSGGLTQVSRTNSACLLITLPSKNSRSSWSHFCGEQMKRFVQ